MGSRLLELIVIAIVVSIVYAVNPVEVKKVIKVVEAKITTVVLLDNGKTQNAVMVSTEKGSSNLNNIGGYVDMKDKKKAPPPPKIMPPEEIKKRFAKALAISPQKPISYRLYFEPRVMKLTEESENVLLEAIKMMEDRSPCMVAVIGHTDTVGTSKNNLKMSVIRATYVKKLIDTNGIEVEALSIKGFGEEDLLVETADNVAEVKNRNVEIYIK